MTKGKIRNKVKTTVKDKVNVVKNKVDNVKTGYKLLSKKKKNFIMGIVLFFIVVLLIVATYAWFSTNLNVKIKNFNMVVSQDSGLSISFDGINYDYFVEISKENLIDKLKNTYPNNTSQWASNGLTPVSTIGLSNKNNKTFDMYATGGVEYKKNDKDNGYVYTTLMDETKMRSFNYYLAFDLFLKNSTGSPVNDNLYFDDGTYITLDSDPTEETIGLINSMRIGLINMGTVPQDTAPSSLQNMGCVNECNQIIFEPNSKLHTELSINRAKKFGVNLYEGNRVPTYASIKEGGPIYLRDTVSGSPKLDPNYFALQNTMTEEEFNKPLFELPDGITKMRVYVWIEGQDIDSLETDSRGAEVSISINFVKDTQGYDQFNN